MPDLGFENVTDFILYPEFSGALLWLKVIFIFLSLLFTTAIIILLYKSTWIRRALLEDTTETFVSRPYAAKQILRDWLRIKKLSDSPKARDQKLAVIEADNLFDDVIKKMGIKGESFSERLDNMAEIGLSNKDGLLWVKKIRNSLVHDPDYKIDKSDGKRALDVYEKALQDLEMF